LGLGLDPKTKPIPNPEPDPVPNPVPNPGPNQVCNLVYHGLICWFMVTDWVGQTAWFLYAPTAAFYVIIAGVIWLALKAVRDIEDGVKLSSLTVIKMWQSIQDSP